MPDRFAGWKRSHVIAARELNAMETKLQRDTLSRTLIQMLINDGKVIVGENAVVRDGLPNSDYGQANSDWETGALTDNTVATFVNGALANNKMAGFYGLASQDPNPVVAVLLFRVGTGGGAARGRFQIERLYAEQESVGYFPDPVIYGATETVFIQVDPRDTKAAPGDNLVLMSLVAEPKGPFVA